MLDNTERVERSGRQLEEGYKMCVETGKAVVDANVGFYLGAVLLYLFMQYFEIYIHISHLIPHTSHFTPYTLHFTFLNSYFRHLLFWALHFTFQVSHFIIRCCVILNLNSLPYISVIKFLSQARNLYFQLLKCMIFIVISEQIGVDIMNNLHRDREVIERARERVSPLELILTGIRMSENISLIQS